MKLGIKRTKKQAEKLEQKELQNEHYVYITHTL